MGLFILLRVLSRIKGKQGAPQKLEKEKHNYNLSPYDIEIIYILMLSTTILAFKYFNKIF
jgi:hypothetical protein